MQETNKFPLLHNGNLGVIDVGRDFCGDRGIYMPQASFNDYRLDHSLTLQERSAR